MFLRLIIFTLLFAVSIMTIFSQTPPIESGVSQTLAKWRAANYSDVRYKLNITLEKGAPLMTGTIEVSVKLTDEAAKNDLVLDWRTTQFQNDKDKPFAEVVAVNGAKPTGTQAARLPERDRAKTARDFSDVEFNQTSFASSQSQASEPLAFQSNEHLIVSKKYLKTGENVLQIKFASPIKTSGSAITRYIDKEDGAEYVYSLFVPSDASTAFPVFDQPDLKARFSLDITTPIKWKVISNTVGITKYGENLHHFVETKPISTYVFAFAAGDFELFSDPNFQESLKKENISFSDSRASLTNIYVRKSQAEKFKQHAAETFRLNREGVKFLEDWFDYKFPFPKYDLVLIPEFPFGGMEHAGATFFREDRIIFPTEPTKNDYITRANLIFHEAAHQWFGDTVTMRWFDDLWLKEGFAEFMAYKTLEKVMPEYNAWKIFYERNKQAAYLTDSTKGTTPIYQEIPNLSAAKSAYGNIVYRKAPSFLKQAEFYLGADKFQTAVRAFLKKHEFANAEWTDLVKEFETADKTLSGSDLTRAWITQAGLWKIKIKKIETIGNDDQKLYANQIHSLGGLNPIQTVVAEHLMKFKVLIIYEDGTREIKDFRQFSLRTFMTDSIQVLKTPILVFPNYQDYGYGIFLLDERSRAYVLSNIQNEKDDFLRSMMWGSLWDSVRFYELAPEEYVKLVIKNIDTETDEGTIQTLLGRVSIAVNYYLSDAQAKQFAPEIEKLFINKIETSPSVGQKITYFRALQSIGSSEQTKRLFKDLLNGTSKLKDVELKTKDKFDLVTRLIVLGDKDALNILTNLEKHYTDDAAKRYAYAARAGIATAENKAKYWNDFVNNKDLSESYIESAFNVWNSPRHSELTLPYLEKALAELPNLKRNRKIFFVNGWLSAFTGGQKSQTALDVINKFLADNPNLDKDLRLKILENSDLIERAVKIRAKYPN